MPEEAMSQEAIDRLLNEMKSGKALPEASKSESENSAATRAQKTAQRTLENEHSHIVPSGSKKSGIMTSGAQTVYRKSICAVCG